MSEDDIPLKWKFTKNLRVEEFSITNSPEKLNKLSIVSSGNK